MTKFSLWESGTPMLGAENPEIWDAFCVAINNLKEIVWQDPHIKDDLARAEGVRYLTRLVAGAIPMTMENWNPEYPLLFKFLSSRIQYGLPAADALYLWAPVHGDYVYRIIGQRGTAHLIDLETRVGHFAHIDKWQMVDRRSDFEVGSDGSIEIVLSRKEQPGNWVKIADGVGDIILRQYFNDWENEEPARIQIRCEGQRYPAPRLTQELIAERTQLLIDWLNNLPNFFQEQVKSYYSVSRDTVIFDPVSIGWPDLRYGKSFYECEEDEALIVKVKLPKVQYWSIQLYSQYWDARDWNMRQSSLNGHQAIIDEDDVFTAVIAHTDPGICNWLDAAGHSSGLLSVRYYKADTLPVPSITRIKFQDIKSYFQDKKHYISQENRHLKLRERSESLVKRGCI